MSVVAGNVGPVPSERPYELLAVLRAGGVAGVVVGSAAAGGPARDLDLVIDTDPYNLTRLHRALEPVALGAWEPTLRRLAAVDGPGPFRVVTSLGWLDLLVPGAAP